jgi:hypothetical protein
MGEYSDREGCGGINGFGVEDFGNTIGSRPTRTGEKNVFSRQNLNSVPSMGIKTFRKKLAC